MAEGMTEEEIEACRLAFEKFDADGSGTIEANELKVTLQSMGQNPTDEEIFEMLSSVDEDGSGREGPKLPPVPLLKPRPVPPVQACYFSGVWGICEFAGLGFCEFWGHLGFCGFWVSGWRSPRGSRVGQAVVCAGML